ncbi:MAG TPA: hypothetical protein VGW34_12690 [Allosphingosinicella sp.]|nr:hypothetical protein [Allosphingosinicella sp.]
MAGKRKKRAGLWRRRFLSALARTANARLAAAMAGVDHSTAYALRRRDAGFAAAWPRARDWGRARVKAEGRPIFANGRPRAAGPAEALDPRELVIRTTRNAGTQIVRAGDGRMSPRTDEIFFTHLAAGFGIRRSAAAAGFSANAVYQRKANDKRFAAGWDAAREQGLARNDMLLIDAVPLALDPAAAAAADGLPTPTIAEAIAIMRLYRPAGGDGDRRSARRGRARFRREPSIEEVRDEIIAPIRAIRRHRAKGGRG